MTLRLMPSDAKPTPENLLRAAETLRTEFELRGQVQDLRERLMDASFLMYLMVDVAQDMKPGHRERHYTNRVPSVVDTAQRVLSRNPLRYRVVSEFFQSQSRAEREPLRRLENVLHGVMYDIDRQQRKRAKAAARSQAAFHSLVRGAWAYKLHLTEAYKDASPTRSPLFYAHLDPRQVRPVFSGSGLESAVAWDIVTFNQVYYQYKDKLQPIMDRARADASRVRQYDWSWLHAPLLMLEWSSCEEAGVLLDLTSLPKIAQFQLGMDKPGGYQYCWLQEPFDHGFEHSLIQYGNVNGIPAGLPTRESAERFASTPFARYPLYQGGSTTEGTANYTPQLLLPSNHGYVPVAGTVDPLGALAGRSIFANVAHMIPEYNEMLALLKNHVRRDIDGTFVLTTRTGEAVDIPVGQGMTSTLLQGETFQKVPMPVNTPDALTLVQMVSQEISDGTIDLRFILAAEQDSGGYTRQRMEQAALYGLDPYKEGLQDYAVSVAESFMQQYRKAGSRFSGWKLQGRTPGQYTSYFVVDVDDQVAEALKGAEPPVVEAAVKAAMPIDMMAKINMAKAAIDPSNPVMSLAMALDIIMEMDDADAVYDGILEDTGNRNPVLQLMQIAQAFIENGAPEIATMIMTDQFRSAYAQSKNAAGGTPQATSTPTGASPGISASTMPPEATSGGATEPAMRGQGGY